ncbi:MAG: DUF4244 domain-containing protein [Leucobacter sp.]
MTTHLTLVVDNSVRGETQKIDVSEKDPEASEESRSSWVHRHWKPGTPRASRTRSGRSLRSLRPFRLLRPRRRVGAALQGDRGAVTAEYAIVIMAAVAFAGLLVAIMRSGEIRQMLVDLVQNALGMGS